MNIHELGNQFDYDYFEIGEEKKKSLYTNFQWLPSISFPIANTIKKFYPNKRILDYGCAKGFIVYALRLLNVEAYGYDISKYAIKNCKKEVSSYLFNKKGDVPYVDVIFIKDVLEHLPYNLIDKELNWMFKMCNEAFFIVPLGEDGKYRIIEYAFDITHIIIEDEEWWSKKFIKVGFKIKEFYHQKEGIKDNWISRNHCGNGIFFLEKDNK